MRDFILIRSAKMTETLFSYIQLQISLHYELTLKIGTNIGCWGASGRAFSKKLNARVFQEIVCYILVIITLKKNMNKIKFNNRERGVLILSNICN